MSKKSLVVDTDVLIDYLRGEPKAIALISSHVDNIILPAIVTAELYAGVRDKEDRHKLDQFLSLFQIVPMTAEVARVGGLLKRVYEKSHNVGLADATITATAQIENADLKTLNTKHYPMFKGLKAPYKKP